MRRLRRVGLVLVVAAAAVALFYTLRQPQDGTPALPPFSLEQRPHEGRLLFDYAGLLEHYREGTRKYLDSITRQFHIEAAIFLIIPHHCPVLRSRCARCDAVEPDIPLPESTFAVDRI